ncbi:sulfotransferase family 2 domain-containing protein [Rubinisphaera sp.]|mgnify:CR=1 FL=1|uniref:sulfotransferase family 2 domain-containing protein n=1 Tax=Rubinisphaera sp. TaxID=2024857 RepID=UPI000C0C80C0|nr:sulfotransferase family 2 domain-containing protein [Rubinisphaera sp.]MBV11989.1 hypothetical protein [Rubinisphaera sp.]HCS55091.1 hypothetical protein [Planctomycetaceae bacterium]|tara:strand:+ start:539 stop:1270 length:732 start_codon:yes stop_codon:yes gene_type:complete
MAGSIQSGVRLSNMQQVTPKIVHMHIPKTAGTSIKSAFVAHYDLSRVCRAVLEPEFAEINPDDYDFFTGHIGFDLASQFGHPIVSVLRDPIDRFISVYYYWRQLYETENRRDPGIVAAHSLSLDEFAERFDESKLIQQFYNQMTWQFAGSFNLNDRRKRIELTQAEVLELAQANMQKCAVVGRKEDLPGFVSDCRKTLGIELDIDKLNVTAKRPHIDEVPLSTRRRIAQWVPLDLELYWSRLK